MRQFGAGNTSTIHQQCNCKKRVVQGGSFSHGPSVRATASGSRLPGRLRSSESVTSKNFFQG